MFQIFHIFFGIVMLACLIPELILPEKQSNYSPGISFVKIIVDEHFTSESVGSGDFNKDGKTDVVACGWWYAGDAFNSRHEIFPSSEFNPHGYSPTTPPCFVADFNRDGWDDVFYVMRQPGPKKNYGFQGWTSDTCWLGVWYENPGRISEPWIRHVVLTNIANESVVWEDLNGDSQKELVYSTPKHFGYATYSSENPSASWTFHPVSHEINNPLSHGVGCGDINGDGRPDIIYSHGWWEQPEKMTDTWAFHSVAFAKKAVQMFAYDVDGDELNDVITVWDAHNYGLIWHRQTITDTGKRDWEPHFIIPSDPKTCNDCLIISQLHALEISDINGDGLMDLVAGKRFWAHGPKMDADPDKPAVLYWFELTRGEKHAGFIPHLIDDDSGAGNQIAVKDLNGDGQADIMTSNKKGTYVHLSGAGNK